MSKISEVRGALLAALPDDVRPSAEVLTGPTPREPKIPPGMGAAGAAFGRQFIVRVLVGDPDSRDVRELLDVMLEDAGKLSVKQAIEADRTLGGRVSVCQVLASSGWRTYKQTRERGPGETEVREVLGAEWTVETA